jgi:hypothetical protein
MWGRPGLHVRCDDGGVALVSDASDVGVARTAVGLRAA